MSVVYNTSGCNVAVKLRRFIVSRSEDIRQYLLINIGRNDPDLVQNTSKEFQISRQSVHKYLRQLIRDRLITASGKTKGREYILSVLSAGKFSYDLSSLQEEDVIWRRDIKPLLADVRSNLLHILEYGFTEMMNNAIEHCEGSKVDVDVHRDATFVFLSIADDGVGIFNKIKRDLNLEDEKHAIFELTKGKLTTDPRRHSGEGIFFTSRMFDQYTILSGKLSFMHMPDNRDWLVEDAKLVNGTTFLMSNVTFTKRTVQEVFDKYTVNKEDYGFDRTHVPVFLARYGDENLVSRSQARRLLARFDRFKEVVLDFADVDVIGQAFADEVFRVFQLQHPEVHLSWTNANESVTRMIKRAKGFDINDEMSLYKQLSFLDLDDSQHS